jgi:hypothetical protein
MSALMHGNGTAKGSPLFELARHTLMEAFTNGKFVQIWNLRLTPIAFSQLYEGAWYGGSAPAEGFGEGGSTAVGGVSGA